MVCIQCLYKILNCFDIIALLRILIVVPNVRPFNIDTKKPIFFDGIQPKAYFGYSLAVVTTNKAESHILVGAPKANMSWMPSIIEPGGVYKCDINKACTEIKIDKESISRDKVLRRDHTGKVVEMPYKDYKNGQWLGASLSVFESEEPELGVCAPKWMNAYFWGSYYTTGICFKKKIFSDLAATPMYPFFKPGNMRKDRANFNYAMTGTTIMAWPITGTKRTAEYYISGPGIFNHAGGVVYMSQFREAIYYYEDTTPNSYFGYALTHLKSDYDRISPVVGGPGYKKVGKVYAVRDSLRWVGYQLGSFFGSSICSIDTNNDKLDELLIGAPLYSTEASLEQGIVYVYMNSPTARIKLHHYLTLQGSSSPRARFGTSMSNIGDINMDSYNDLAVGAPFEDDSSGCVYIYNGGKDGLIPRYSQRISGKSLRSDLKSFGWSLSKSTDMDSNQYADFAVGAFQSDVVVLLRSRPIMEIRAKFDVSPKVINQNQAPSRCEALNNRRSYCLKLTLCLSFTILKFIPSQTLAVVDVNLLSDARKQFGETGRATFIVNGRSISNKLTTRMNLEYEKESCTENYVLIQLTPDILSPIVFEARYELNSTSSSQLPPVLSHLTQKTIRTDATFMLQCGPDNICSTDISITMQAIEGLPHDGFFIVGLNNQAKLRLYISNTEEAAYETIFSTVFPSQVQYVGNKWQKSKSVITCSKGAENLLCNMGNPFEEKSNVTGELLITVSHLDPTTKQITFKGNITSTSTDTDLSNNADDLTAQVRLKADINIRGESVPEQQLFKTLQESIETHTTWTDLNFTHEIAIYNKGPSLLPRGNLIILIPAKDDEDVFACYYNSKIQLRFDNTSTRDKQNCLVHTKFSNPRDALFSTTSPSTSPTMFSTTLVTNETTQYFFANEQVERRRRKRSTNSRSRGSSKKIIDCTKYSCIRIDCDLEGLLPEESAYITLNLGLFEEKITRMMDKSVALYKTAIYLLRQDKPELAPLLDKTTVVSEVISTLNPIIPPTGKISIWIYIGSSIAACVILLILAIILAKCGFFKRKRHKQVQEIKRQSMIRKSTYKAGAGEETVADIDNMSEEFAHTTGVKMRPPSHYTVSPSEEAAPELQNKEPLPEPPPNPARPVSIAIPEEHHIADSVESLVSPSETGSLNPLPPPPDNL